MNNWEKVGKRYNHCTNIQINTINTINTKKINKIKITSAFLFYASLLLVISPSSIVVGNSNMFLISTVFAILLTISFLS